MRREEKEKPDEKDLSKRVEERLRKHGENARERERGDKVIRGRARGLWECHCEVVRGI